MKAIFEPTGFCMAWVRVALLSVSLLAAGLIPTGAKVAQGGSAIGAEATTATVAGQADSAAKTGKTQKVETKEYQLSPERYAKAIAYSRAGYLIYFVSVFWEIAALVLLLSSRAVAKLRDFAEEKSKSFWLQAVLFVAPLSLLLALLNLPIRMYWHHLSLQYEQSIQRWGSWFWDWSKGELLATALGILAAMLLLAIIRWRPRTWWLYFWAAAMPLSAFLVFLSPWVFDPMFHTFRPLGETHPELVQAIGKLTAHAGVPIPADRMFLMEASEKTNQLNAYVTGLGASKRVVVWDTMISHANPDELLAVVGHELGHYALGHVLKGFAFGVVGMFFGLYAAYLALQWVLKHRGATWGVRGQGDWAALAVLLLIANVLSFLSEPIGNGISRMQEHAADVYSLEVIHGIVPDGPEAAAHSFQVMGEHDLADPNPPPFVKFWLYSHPPLGDRVNFAHNYDPWSKGQEPKYVK
jgi:STE24 endopeptidase